MSIILQKMVTGFRVFSEKGFAGISNAARRHLLLYRNRRPGNLVVIDGCQISLEGLSDQVRYWLLTGEYESSERLLLNKINRSLPVIELGGSLGVVACLTNRLLTEPGRHIVVEANPQLIPHIESNKKRNQCKFQVSHAAVAYGVETLEFPIHDNSLESSLFKPGGKTESVLVTSLEALHREAGFEQFTLICDIEGGETEMIYQEQEFLVQWVDTMIMEIHPGIASHVASKEAMDILERRGFKTTQCDRDTYLLVNQRFTRSCED